MPVAPRGYSAVGATVAGTDTSGTIKVAAYFTGVIVRMGELNQTRDDLETTTSETTPVNGAVQATFVPNDIVENGEYEIDILHDTQNPPPWGDVETIVITYPKRGSAVSAAKKTFPGYLKKHSTSHPLKGNQGIVSKCTLKVAGAITITAAS